MRITAYLFAENQLGYSGRHGAPSINTTYASVRDNLLPSSTEPRCRLYSTVHLKLQQQIIIFKVLKYYFTTELSLWGLNIDHLTKFHAIGLVQSK